MAVRGGGGGGERLMQDDLAVLLSKVYAADSWSQSQPIRRKGWALSDPRGLTAPPDSLTRPPRKSSKASLPFPKFQTKALIVGVTSHPSTLNCTNNEVSQYK